jgi:hypothetical protein
MHTSRCKGEAVAHPCAHVFVLPAVLCCRLWSKVVAGAPRENAPLAPAKGVV